MNRFECLECHGTGQAIVTDAMTGCDTIPCLYCAGSGLDQEGLILLGVLKPPAGGCGVQVL